VFRTIQDPGGNAEQKIVDSDPTGNGRNHPHAQRTTSDGALTVFPNVVKGFGGVAGSIGVVEMATNRLRAEFRAPEITMPVAAGIQGVTQGWRRRRPTRRSGPGSPPSRPASATHQRPAA
jgi:hypothetical protein